MCPSAHRVCSEPGGQRPVLSLSLDLTVLCEAAGSVEDNKVHGANMGPTWVLSAPDGPHVGPTNLAIRDVIHSSHSIAYCWKFPSDSRLVSSRGYAIQPSELVYALLGCSRGLVEITPSLLIAGVSHLPKYVLFRRTLPLFVAQTARTINRANLRDLIAATGLVILLKMDSIVDFSARVALKFDGWPWKTIGHLFYHGWGTTQRREWILDELRNRFCTIFATNSWHLALAIR